MTPPPAATAAGRAVPRVGRSTGAGGGRLPRRRSGPARGARAGVAVPWPDRALRRGRTVADSRLLHQLMAGRLWILLVAAGLMGIVFMQVTMLKLNAGIGRDVERAGMLERQNALLRADVSRMESGENIDAVAQREGMVVPADGSTRFVTAGEPGAATTAAHRLTAPDPEAVQRSRASTATPAAPTAAAATSTSSVPAAATRTQTAAPVQTPAAVATTSQQPTTPATTATTGGQASTPGAATAPAAQQASGAPAAGGVAAPDGQG